MYKDKNNPEYIRITKMLQKYPKFNGFIFHDVDESTLEKNECEVTCMKCGRRYVHKNIYQILSKQVDRCDVCIKKIKIKNFLENGSGLIGEVKITDSGCTLRVTGDLVKDGTPYLKIFNFGIDSEVEILYEDWENLEGKPYFLGAEIINKQGFHCTVIKETGTKLVVQFDDKTTITVSKTSWLKGVCSHKDITSGGYGKYGDKTLMGISFNYKDEERGNLVVYNYIEGENDTISKIDSNSLIPLKVYVYVIDNSSSFRRRRSSSKSDSEFINYKFSALCPICGKRFLKTKQILKTKETKILPIGKLRLNAKEKEIYDISTCGNCKLSNSMKGVDRSDQALYLDFEGVNSEGFKYKALRTATPSEIDGKKGYYYVEFEDGTVQLVDSAKMRDGKFLKYEDIDIGESIWDVFGIEYSVIDVDKSCDNYTLQCLENDEVFYNIHKSQIYSRSRIFNPKSKQLLKGKVLQGLNGDTYTIVKVLDMKNVRLKNNSTGNLIDMKFGDKGLVNYIAGDIKIVEYTVGSKVVSIGGFIGYIIEVNGNICSIKMNDGSVIQVRTQSIGRGHFLPEGVRIVKTYQRRQNMQGYVGEYRGFILKGIYYKESDNFLETYYNCYKGNSTELQILRPMDIDALYT